MHARAANHNRISPMFGAVNMYEYDSVNGCEYVQKVSHFNDKKRACIKSLKLGDVACGT